MNFLSQTDSLIIIENSIYSTFEEKKVIVGCFLESQVIGLVPSSNIKLIIDRPLVKSLIHSISI